MLYAGSFSRTVIKLINTRAHLYAYRMREKFGARKNIAFDNNNRKTI